MKNKFHTFSIIIAIIGGCLVLICTSKYGIGLTHDSGYYIYASKMFIQKGQLLDISNKTLLLYPPLFPVLLSIASILNIDCNTFCIFLNAISFALIILFSSFMINKSIHNSMLKVLSGTSIFISVPIFMDSIFVWSDILFILFSTTFLYSITKFLEDGRKKYFFFSILFCVLSFYQRYTGLSTVFCGMMILLFNQKKLNGERIKESLIFTCISSILIGLWFLRNKLSTGQIAMSYTRPGLPVYQNILDLLEIVSSYFIPNAINFILRIAFFLILIVFIFYIFKKYSNNNIHLISLIAFIICYSGFMIFSNSFYMICSFDDRYLSPLYIPIMLVFFISVDMLLNNIPAHLARIFSAIILIWLLYPMARFAKNFHQWYNVGAGYNSIFWQDEELMTYIKEKNLKGKIWSNNPLPIVCMTKRLATSLEDIKYLDSKDTSYLVRWSDKYTLNYLKEDTNKYHKHFRFEKIYGSLDGNIYKLIPK